MFFFFSESRQSRRSEHSKKSRIKLKTELSPSFTSVHMGAISTNMCGGIFIHVFYAYVEFSLLLCVCVCVRDGVCDGAR